MALSIAVMRGWKIDVGGSVLEVLDVPDPYHKVVVAVNGNPPVNLTHTEREELLPEVFAYVGLPESAPLHKGLSRIAFEAPLRIKIKSLQ